MASDDFNVEFNAGGDYNADNDNLVLDLNGVNEESEFEALPNGIYNCIVDSAEFGDSSSGNPMITWKFAVTDEPYKKRLLFYHTVLHTDLGKAALKKILLRVVPDADLSSFSPKGFCDEGVAIGLPCRVRTKIELYKNKKKNTVKEVLAPEEGGFMSDF